MRCQSSRERLPTMLRRSLRPGAPISPLSSCRCRRGTRKVVMQTTWRGIRLITDPSSTGSPRCARLSGWCRRRRAAPPGQSEPCSLRCDRSPDDLSFQRSGRADVQFSELSHRVGSGGTRTVPAARRRAFGLSTERYLAPRPASRRAQTCCRGGPRRACMYSSSEERSRLPRSSTSPVWAEFGGRLVVENPRYATAPNDGLQISYCFLDADPPRTAQ